jgi:rubrerythrin
MKFTKDDFIRSARKVHGDKYDYSKVVYKNNKTDVCIICPIHGEFYQTPNSHLKGRGCPICGGTKKSTKEDFIIKAKQVHGDKYDYSKVVYVNNQIKVCIICPIHGEFYQTPKNHLSGQGCPKCSGNKNYT